jgi:hypothetical protein
LLEVLLHRNLRVLGQSRFGSWSCENAQAGSLTGLGCGATTLREVCEHIFPISSATQTDGPQAL